MVSGGLEWFTVVSGGLEWFAMVFGGLEWFAVVSGGLEWFTMVSAVVSIVVASKPLSAESVSSFSSDLRASHL